MSDDVLERALKATEALAEVVQRTQEAFLKIALSAVADWYDAVGRLLVANSEHLDARACATAIRAELEQPIALLSVESINGGLPREVVEPRINHLAVTTAKRVLGIPTDPRAQPVIFLN